MLEAMQQFQTYITAGLILLMVVILTTMQRFRDAIASIWSMALIALKFIADGFTESSGKTSFSRVAGAYVIIRITMITSDIPSEWMTLFMFLIGYQLISGLLKDNPALLELVKAKYGLQAAAPPAAPAAAEAQP